MGGIKLGKLVISFIKFQFLVYIIYLIIRHIHVSHCFVLNIESEDATLYQMA